MKILVIVAHPDDEILGMGGTLKKLVKNGHKIKLVIMATGIFARRSEKYLNSHQYEINSKQSDKMFKQIKQLRIDAKKANKILGVTDIDFEDFPDNEMDKVSNLEITKKVENLIDKFKPEVVYTHSQYDINVDHRALYYATITATRPRPKLSVKEVISFEVPSSTEWYFPQKFAPNIFVEIEKELSFKIKALKQYKNEIRKFPHPRSPEALDAIAKRWGTVSGFRAAEAFCLVRQLRI
jgi:LmbE family N-acetylglucosaminyl deacetylase